MKSEKGVRLKLLWEKETLDLFSLEQAFPPTLYVSFLPRSCCKDL